MVFAFPWMLLGFLALPVLAGIYWLRSRSKMRMVSSLILWTDQRVPRQGGQKIQRLQTPLTFLMELLALVAIVIAASGPSLVSSQSARPIIVVLDDSYSMLAGGSDNPRQRGIDALAVDFRKTDYNARFIVAGTRARLVGEPIRTADSLHGVLDQWTCRAPTSSLEQAIALAAEVGGESSRILVISDHAPLGELATGKVQWWAFGTTVQNIAITAAARDVATGDKEGPQDRVLLEVTNFGREPAHTELILQGANLAAPRRNPVDLAQGAASRFFVNLPRDSAPLRATLSDDALKFDNEVVLVSPRNRLLRVQVSLAGGGASGGDARTPVERALTATGQAELVDSRPDLIITDGTPPRGDAWTMQVIRGPEPASYSGPFVLDRNHPLTEGLSLDAVIWTATVKTTPTGGPVVSAGNAPLLTDNEEGAGRHRLQIALEPGLSNVVDSPDWPILIANLVRWRLGTLPGCATPNVRLGQAVRITLADESATAKDATLVLPDGTQRTLAPRNNQLEIQPELTGLYKVQIGAVEYEVACNALNADESNLELNVTNRWGNWNQSQVFQDRRVSLEWVFVMAALVCLGIHLNLVHRAGGSGA